MNKEDLTLCLKNDRRAQKRLYEAYKNRMFILCQRYFSNKEDSRDALQEGFIKVFKDLHQYDENKAALGTWMNRVFVNTCLQKLRKKKVDFKSIGNHTEMIGFDATIISDLNLKDLTKVIQKLPVGYRTVFNLYVIEGYNHREISSQLGIAIGTSKTQLMKAKKMLRIKLAETLNEI